MREPAHLSRRSLAAALPLVAIAATSAQSTAATADDNSLPDIGRRWAVAYDAMKANDHEYDRSYMTMTRAEEEANSAAANRLFEAERSLFETIVTTPARTIQGLAVKAEALAPLSRISATGAWRPSRRHLRTPRTINRALRSRLPWISSSLRGHGGDCGQAPALGVGRAPQLISRLERTGAFPVSFTAP